MFHGVVKIYIWIPFSVKNKEKKKHMRSFHTVRNACLLNTRSTIHNKLRGKKIDIDINVHRYYFER